MTDEQLAAILGEVKAKMNLPDGDSSYDGRIKALVEDGAAALASDLAIEGPSSYDWTQPGRSRSLLVNYCFYGVNNAVEQFHGDFAQVILAERDANLAEQFEASDEA